VSSKRKLIALALTAAFLAAGVMPDPARAATYTVWSCADGAGKPLPAGDWSANTVGTAVVATTTCGAAGAGGTAGNLQAVAGSGPGQPDSGVEADWHVSAAPGTTINALDVWWMNQAGLQSPSRIQVYAENTSLYQRDGGAFGSAALPYGNDNHQAFTGLSATSTTLVAWCLPPFCATPEHTIGATFQAYRLRVTVSDTDAPAGEVSGIGDDMTIGAPVPVFARATDAGGGVRDLQLVIDGKPVDTKQAGGQCDDIDPTSGDADDYALMDPCPAQLPAAGLPPAQFTVTPAMLGAAGAHTVAVVAHDAAGNAATLLSRRVVMPAALLDGSATPTFYDAARDLFFNPDADTTGTSRPNGSNAGPAKLTLAIAAKRVTPKGRVFAQLIAHRTISYTAGSRVVGTVSTLDGRPIAHARVYQATSIAGASWTLNPAPLMTDASGNVSFVLRARNPSRRVELVYFPQNTSNESFRSPSVLVRVRVPVALELSRRSVPRGTPVNITARLRAAANPRASVIGALQLRVGRHWRTIRRLRFTPRAHGVVHTALRLRTPSTYRLRLRVSAQRGLSYTTGASPTRVLRVR
jgi:hypothetical protein